MSNSTSTSHTVTSDNTDTTDASSRSSSQQSSSAAAAATYSDDGSSKSTSGDQAGMTTEPSTSSSMVDTSIDPEHSANSSINYDISRTTDTVAESSTPLLVASPGNNQASSLTQVIVPIVCLIVVLVGVLAVLWYLRFRSRNKRKGGPPCQNLINLAENGFTNRIKATSVYVETEPDSGQTLEPEIESECPSAEAAPTSDDDFLSYVQRHQEDLLRYQTEFNSLPDGTIKSSSVARIPENIVKNRYVNILPYDENRVVLSKTLTQDSDYINASYIDGAKKKRAYIAPQGPVAGTLSAFWSMIWENDCRRLLMLTNLEEVIRGIATAKACKCAQYWPSPVGQEKKFGDINVCLLEETIATDWTIRKLAVDKEGCDGTRTIYQYHYTTWPDQDVPPTSTGILKFIQLALKSTDRDDDEGPVIIHCSAGVGRTGTLIAIDILLDQSTEIGEKLDVFKCVQGLRLQRMSMVQSVIQYIFIHHSLLQALRLNDDEVQMTPDNLTKEDHCFTQERLKEQFRILNAVSLTSIPHYSISKTRPDKNRSPAVLPANSLIRFLKPVKEDDNVYINAISVHSFRQRNAFLVTQMPLVGTINDFWRLVNDNQCGAIVMLNSTFLEEERYWPDEEEEEDTLSFNVRKTRAGNDATDGIILTHLEIHYRGKLETGSDSSSDDEISLDSIIATGHDRNSTDSVIAPSSSTQLKVPLPSERDEEAGRQSRASGVGKHRVRHLRVSDWPETEKFPRDASLLLKLYDRVKKYRANNRGKPVIIHCLYGAERTGLFCAMINILDRLEKHGVIGIFDAIKTIRKRRPEFIADVEQYNYLHELVSEYLKSKETSRTERQSKEIT